MLPWLYGATTIWGRAVCSASGPAPLESSEEEIQRAYPNVSDPRHVAFFWPCSSQNTRAPAWNADPRNTACSWACFSQRTKAPARNADPRRIAFSWACFFLRKTRAPARNGNPRDIAFSLDMVVRKTKAPARNADPRDIASVWACFSSKTTAPARNADPNTTAFCRPEHHKLCFRALLGTPTRETECFPGHVFQENKSPS